MTTLNNLENFSIQCYCEGSKTGWILITKSTAKFLDKVWEFCLRNSLVRRLPRVVTSRHILVYEYMLAKFTLRWKFFQTAAILCNAPKYHLVREVVNPSKDHKLEEVALRYHINPEEFKRVSCQLRRVWPLLP